MAVGKIQLLNRRYLICRLFNLKSVAFSFVLYFILIQLSIGCHVPSENNAEKTVKPVPVYNAAYTFPEKIVKSLQQKYPNLVPIKKSDYAPLFWDFYDAETLPATATTDINNDQKSDFGYIVRDHDVLKVAIALSDGRQYRYWLSPFTIGLLEKTGVDFCIEIKPAGRTDIVKPSTSSLLLQKNGFLIKKLEQDNIIIYENEGEIAFFNMK
ncbi:hypothetical protein [Pedobacter sp. N23S346]|uniref:hypothetical protein n=1 Tax=Pedobacter sp. N23S346 TaxID=3402750 RepID=UPI003ACFB528